MSEQHPHPDTGGPYDECVVCRLEARIDRLVIANNRLYDKLKAAEALVETARTKREEEADYNRRMYVRLRAMPANDDNIGKNGGERMTRLRMAWAILCGRALYPNGCPTPWAYEQACAALWRHKDALRVLRVGADVHQRRIIDKALNGQQVG